MTFLGTGTSQGVPVITCDCAVCTSPDEKDMRLRSALLIKQFGKNILIDTGPDLRQQMLVNHVQRLDAVLLTHEHNDHTIGLDDIRPFNFRQQYDMPVYGLERVLADVKSRFKYIFENDPYPGIPRVVCHSVGYNERFTLFNAIEITTLRIMHGNLPILGYRIGDFAYVTDASLIDDETFGLLKNLKVLVLNALQIRPHYSHFNLTEAIEISEKINAEKTFFTHISHNLGRYEDLKKNLPPGILPAFDRLKLMID